MKLRDTATIALTAITLLVREYDEAIEYFTNSLGFRLLEDSPLPDGKRWVLVAPDGSPGLRILLARACTPAQASAIGKQTGTPPVDSKNDNCDISAGFKGSAHEAVACSFSGSVDIDHGHGMGGSTGTALTTLAGATGTFMKTASVTGYSSDSRSVTGSGSTSSFTPSGSVSPALTIDPLTIVPTPQLSGKKATDNSLITQYGKRSLIETFTWIKSSAQCQAIADGVISDRGVAQKSGTVKLILTPAAHIGDLVYTKLPSVEVNGSSIDEKFTVFKVQHSIGQNSAVTTLDLGRVVKTAYDYIGLVAKVAKTCKKNFCKG
jgi:hypothetical protein